MFHSASMATGLLTKRDYWERYSLGETPKFFLNTLLKCDELEKPQDMAMSVMDWRSFWGFFSALEHSATRRCQT